MYRIKKINWLSREIKEAEVNIFDGNFNVVVFSHPFNRKEDEIISALLYALNTDNIIISDIQKYYLNRISNTFSYHIIGIVVNKSKSQIKIGEFIIELDVELPNDIKNGDFVSFNCDRIDLVT